MSKTSNTTKRMKHDEESYSEIEETSNTLYFSGKDQWASKRQVEMNAIYKKTSIFIASY